ncbi:MAG: DNA polymerase III delta subunit [Firmicutes bacterium]|nr:DNA polymerase III delta subunit [Bacillota bacterium]MDI6706884.1 DNA polymerase III subunit delta [Bacillota bacterium]
MDYVKFFSGLNKEELHNLYLFYGEEEFLKREAVNRVKELAVPPSMEEMNFTVFEGGRAAAEQMAAAVETLPFMSGKRVILVRDINLSASGKDRLKQEEMERLENCFAGIPEFSCVLLTTKHPVDSRMKLVKTIKANGTVIEFTKLKPDMFEKWVKKQFEIRGKKLKTTAIKAFAASIGYFDKNSSKTLDDVVNEIDKLTEYCKDKVYIEESDFEKVIPKTLDVNVFRLVDAVGYRDTATAVKVLEDMRQAGEPGLRILFMISRQFRLLYQSKQLIDSGYSSKAVAAKLRIQPFVAASVLKQASSFDGEELREALKACSDTDFRIKSGKLDQWLALELLIIGLGNKGSKKSVL